MKKIPVIVLLAFFAMPAIYGQIKIGDNPQAISATSVLELESNDRVLVITRINTVQMDAIIPNQGAMVYNTDTQCIHYYNGIQWINLCNSAGLAFTTDPIVNDVSTIVITDQAGTKNFEVAPNSIGSLQIINGGINGVDIQNGSIGPGKLQDQSVTQEKLSENSVGAFALDNANINLSDFTNDQGFITGADIVSGDGENNISIGTDNGAFYDNQPVLDAVGLNTTSIQNHIAADVDTEIDNEIQTLSFNAGANQLTLTNPSGNNVITLPGGGGTTELADGITITGVGTAGDRFKIEPSATNGQFLSTDGTGNVAWANLPPGGGAALFNPATISGTGVLGNEYTVADNGISTIKIVDANVTPIKISPSTTNGQFLGTDATGAVAWADLPPSGGAALFNPATISGTGVLGNEYTVADDAITLDKIADNGANGGDVMRWDDTAGEWIVEAAPGEHTGTAQNIFYAATDGTPTTADDNGFTNDNGGLFYDPEGRQVGGGRWGALYVGLDGGTPSTEAKVHISDNFPGVAYALQLQNQSATSAGRTTGILFSTEGSSDSYGKGALVYERQDSWARGDFHFLQNSTFGAGTNVNPTLADAAFTIKNNKDIRLYGGIDVDGTPTGLGTPGQVLTSTGAGVQWGAGGGGVAVFSDGTTIVGDGATVGTQLQVPTDGITTTQIADGTITNVDLAPDAVTTDKILDGEVQTADLGDLSVTLAKIEPLTPAPATNNMLITNTAGIVAWANVPSGLTPPTDTDTDDGLSDYSATTGYDVQIDDSTIEIATDALQIKDQGVTLAKILPESAAPVTDQMLITNTSGTVVWSSVPIGGNNLSNTNLTQTAGQDRTYDLSGRELIFTGAGGQIGIGDFGNTGPASVRSKLDVDGQITASNGFASSQGTAAQPGYGFFTNGDTNTGMFRIAEDELGFSAGGQEILRLEENGGLLDAIVAGRLNLEAELIDINNVAGTLGQILTSTGAGVDWVAPAVVAMGKANGGVSINVNGATVGGGAGVNIVTLTPPRPDDEYIIQLTVQGDNRVYVTNQAAGSFTVEIRRNSDDVLEIAEWYFTILDF